MTSATAAERTAITSPLIEATFHVGTLFSPDGMLAGEYIELRAFHGNTVERTFYRHSALAVQAALRLSDCGFDVFIGIAPRSCAESEDITRCPHKGRDGAPHGGKVHVRRIGWAFCEIDAGKGEYSRVADILARLDGLALPPDMVIASGAGCHAYWRLEPPTADVARFERLTRALRRQLGHDPAVDISRVLRVAGSRNHKYPERPIAAVVRRPHANA